MADASTQGDAARDRARARQGAGRVIGMLDARAPFRRVLVDLIGTGRRALR
jgi:hypothetical protein